MTHGGLHPHLLQVSVPACIACYHITNACKLIQGYVVSGHMFVQEKQNHRPCGFRPILSGRRVRRENPKSRCLAPSFPSYSFPALHPALERQEFGVIKIYRLKRYKEVVFALNAYKPEGCTTLEHSY
jgi:hypothetical protein